MNVMESFSTQMTSLCQTLLDKLRSELNELKQNNAVLGDKVKMLEAGQTDSQRILDTQLNMLGAQLHQQIAITSDLRVAIDILKQDNQELSIQCHDLAASNNTLSDKLNQIQRSEAAVESSSSSSNEDHPLNISQDRMSLVESPSTTLCADNEFPQCSEDPVLSRTKVKARNDNPRDQISSRDNDKLLTWKKSQKRRKRQDWLHGSKNAGNVTSQHERSAPGTSRSAISREPAVPSTTRAYTIKLNMSDEIFVTPRPAVPRARMGGDTHRAPSVSAQLNTNIGRECEPLQRQYSDTRTSKVATKVSTAMEWTSASPSPQSLTDRRREGEQSEHEVLLQRFGVRKGNAQASKHALQELSRDDAQVFAERGSRQLPKSPMKGAPSSEL